MGFESDPRAGLRPGARLSTGHEVREVRRGGFSEVGVVEGRHGERLAVKRIRGELRARFGSAADQAFLRECEVAVARLGQAPYTARPVLAMPALEQVEDGPRAGAADGEGRDTDEGRVAEVIRVALGPALFMEYVDGPALAELLAAGRLSLSQSARVCGGVAGALAHAHAAEVCHRDLKPTNILLTRANEVRLIDWGLSGAGDLSEVTTRIEYLSPQRAERMDLAAPPDDVYALGMIFHQCLTGRLTGHWPLGDADALRREPAARCPDVPEELAHIVVAMLSPRPEDRPTAQAIADTLLHGDLAGTLAERDLYRPFCGACGFIGVEAAAGSGPGRSTAGGTVCPICDERLVRRVDRAPGPDMVRIPAGPFVHGLSDSQARHALITARMAPDDEQVRQLTADGRPRKVFCRSFDIDRTPVTNAQYAAFVDDLNYPEPHGFREALAEAPDHPVTSVSWRDAVCYALWCGKRLPTPLEWEKAARGAEDDRMYPWGSAFDRARCSGPPGGPPLRTTHTSPVGALPAGRSPWGVLDMTGNVNEWVAAGSARDFRGVRGGAAGELLEVYGLVSYQSQARVDHTDPAIGFRCASDVGHELVPYEPGESPQPYTPPEPRGPWETPAPALRDIRDFPERFRSP
ncbi:SUMF1/EgtB/PvdO family nonheme iron enzyme [Streptomyces halobius]|uniref:SUMF1/EgtB/PvdO family nonheme iron enzyme n=1 Tax=Streptomyces halobius TaxID=2879846 RepID=A0ABY4MC08_9ACTN|nr:SUMF1/EgtB/PvdO family nonheme iron enzyme [Streptomyces halobius]UQA95315.1 SUMF1/EgtB/PvdO family nonheme iron enzyme [Streptomyces halobius]